MNKKILKKVRENISQYGLKQEEINLNNCKPGDILISIHGAILEYVGKTTWQYLDHIVKYVSMENGTNGNYGDGTRTNDGFVFLKNRRPEIDHDIARVIKKSDLIY